MDNDLIPEELRKIEVYAADLSSATDELSYAVAEFNGSMTVFKQVKKNS